MLSTKKNLILIEVEIKIQISDPNLIRKKFKEQNGIYKLSLIHEDTYYNMPSGLRDFRFTDEALRIRNSIEFNKENEELPRKRKSYITYKGKKLDKISKSRKEIEVEVENVEEMKEIFSVLGFQQVLTVKKERDLYEFEYEGFLIEALIDYLSILGKYFIEVELMAKSHNDLASTRDVLFNFLSLFGYRERDSIQKSYLELILEKIMKKKS